MNRVNAYPYSKKVSYEYVLFAAAFLLALLVRFANLENVSLSAREAELALQSMGIARGQDPLLGPQPAYLLLTAALMFVFRASDWVARFWPALAGSLLVLLPVLFRGRIGKLPALLLAFFLALDPGLVAVSRQAGSLPLVIFSVLLAIGMWINGRTLLAGIAAGLALLSGPAVWPGLIGLFLAAWAAGMLRFSSSAPVEGLPDEPSSPLRPAWKGALIAALATIFLVGTLFFTVPTGLSAMADSLPAYLRGWLQASGESAGLVLGGLLLYAFVPLFFGVWGAVSGLLRAEKIDIFLLLWWVIAFVLALIYPSRSLADMTWALIPLWVLAARQIARLARIPSYDLGAVIGHALLVGVILAFVSLTTVGYFNNPAMKQQEVTLRFIGSAVMLIASTGLVAWGWSGKVALRGLVFGASMVMFAYLLSSAFNAGGLSSRRSQELWYNSPHLRNGDLLLETIDQLNQWGPRETDGLELAVVDVPSPALRWALRDIKRVTFVSSLPADSSPALVITPNQPELALAATYRGQGLIIGESEIWSQFVTSDWVRWVAFRTIPAGAQVQDQVILWARLDLFPGGDAGAAVEQNAGSSVEQNPQENPK